MSESSSDDIGYTYLVESDRGRTWEVHLRAIPTEGGVLITKDCIDPHHPDGFERLRLGGVSFVPAVEDEQDKTVREVNEIAKQLVSSPPVVADIEPDFGGMTLKELRALAKERGIFVGNKRRARLIKDLSNL